MYQIIDYTIDKSSLLFLLFRGESAVQTDNILALLIRIFHDLSTARSGYCSTESAEEVQFPKANMPILSIYVP